MKNLKRLSSVTIFLLSLSGILLQMGLARGQVHFASLNYFTLLSNVLVMLIFLHRFVENKYGYHWIKGAGMMCIMVTGLVYNLLLAKEAFVMGLIDGQDFQTANQILHTIVPTLVVLDYIFFDKKGKFNFTTPFTWAILPNLYFIVTSVMGFVSKEPLFHSGRFPYFFMDYDLIGTVGVIKNIIVLNVLFILLGFIIVIFDKTLKKAIG